MTYYTTEHEHSYTISPPDTSDEPYTATGDYGLHVIVKSLTKTKPQGMHTSHSDYDLIYGEDDIPVGEYAYVVVVQYQTGDTFGSHEDWTVPAIVSTPEKAKAIVAKCYDEDDRPDGRAYREWDGYFEHLQSAKVEVFKVGT